MDETTVKIRTEEALDILLKEDSYLLEVDANERSITHKLAEYLQQEFPGYNVDCEYNKDADNRRGTKEIIIKYKENSMVQITQETINKLTGRINDTILHDIEKHYKHLTCSCNGLKKKLIKLGCSEKQDIDLIFEHSETIQRIFPDIIIHKRGNNENNLLVIEAKKSTSNIVDDEDKTKLETLKKAPYNYSNALFVKFYTGINYDVELTWYKNGGWKGPYKLSERNKKPK